VSPWQSDVRESNANGSAKVGQKRAMPFRTTHWSVVLEAQSESPAAQKALEKLCRIYWRPIYTFVRRQAIAPEEAEDVTQAFFADLLEHKSLTAVRKEKGRFRSYLLGALKYFLADERRRGMAIKRGKGQRLIPLEELNANERKEMEPSDLVTAEQIPSQANIAAQLGMTANAVRQAFHRFRQRYQSLLREEIAHTVATPADIEDELRHLIAVVRG
jgi:DNA-directed RNA polymerase specialized sigma24 family protein